VPRAVSTASLLSVSFSVSCLLAAPSLAGCSPALRRAPEIPHTVSFNTHAYDRFSIKELRGKVVVLFFWSGSSVVCRPAVDRMNRLYEAYRTQGLEIVGVHAPEWESFQGAAHDVYEDLQTRAIRFPVVLDEGGRIQAAYGTFVVPSVCLVDRNGFVRAQLTGVLDFDQIEAVLGQLLSEDGRPAPEGLFTPTTEKERFKRYEEGPSGY